MQQPKQKKQNSAGLKKKSPNLNFPNGFCGRYQS